MDGQDEQEDDKGWQGRLWTRKEEQIFGSFLQGFLTLPKQIVILTNISALPCPLHHKMDNVMKSPQKQKSPKLQFWVSWTGQLQSALF